MTYDNLCNDLKLVKQFGKGKEQKRESERELPPDVYFLMFNSLMIDRYRDISLRER